ncbi:MAG: hypothetical protein ACO3ZW_04610 [Opitutales bacterium]|jgi:hypothetical protein
MMMQVGVWLDHRKAVVVRMVDGEEHLQTILSDVEKHVRPAGGARSKLPYGPQDIMKEDSRERKFRQHLARWYDEVAGHLQGADELLVFGPGEAKTEFRKHIEGTPLRDKLSGIETVDKMTDGQIAAKVRKFYIPGKYPVA